MKARVRLEHEGYGFEWWLGAQYVHVWLPDGSGESTFKGEWVFQFTVPLELSHHRLTDPGEGFFDALQALALEWIRDFEAEEADEPDEPIDPQDSEDTALTWAEQQDIEHAGQIAPEDPYG